MKKRTTMILALILIALLNVPLTAMAASAEIVASVSFRSGPSTSSSVMKYLHAGDKVEILSEVNDYWYQVKDSGGSTGYVSTSSRYIKPSAASGGSAPAGTGTGTIISSVSFREGPSTSAARMRYLARGETVTILSQPNSYWYNVRDSHGVTGYISTDKQYIQVSGQPTAPVNPGNGNNGSGDQNALVEKVIAAGMKYLGTPYEFGSDRNTTTTFDCSDFVRTAFKDGINLTLPADSRQQGTYVKQKGHTTTNWQQLKRGDLMFFMSYKGTSKSAYSGIDKSKQTITHVGIYLGNGQILQTYSKESGGVRTDTIAGKHWEYRFMFGGSAI
ncbi:SH3 domain-containing protein [Paenibacillus sepulcri]|uniref:C40 family peptidase n=1 Tax=Paenibacillus sepulcri TaxID=359917 RepID=A0ABS7C2V4_9BACL|nr:C40 family peptidase [Paenibacillus sepulcri]